jgi:hypothetical protein
MSPPLFWGMLPLVVGVVFGGEGAVLGGLALAGAGVVVGAGAGWVLTAGGV